MSFLSTYWFFILLSVISLSSNHESCYAFDKEGAKHLATKTPYRVVANTNDSIITYKDCQPIKIVAIIRHGTRTPGKKVIRKIKKKLVRIRDVIKENDSLHLNYGKFCEFDIDHIKKWKFELDREGEKVLTSEGENEMMTLARRFQNRFPSLLNKDYSNHTFYFRFTDTQRTHESAKYFTIGLFGEENSKNVWFPTAIYKDPILRFYKLCERWRLEVKKNPLSMEEFRKYIESEEVENLVERVTSRIGLNYSLTFEDVHLMYVTCCFETAWSKSKPSSWCALFSENDLKIMEYGEELKHYWRDGYGYELNHNQACPLMENIFSIFKSNDDLSSVFYFTHSGTILKLLSHLRLYKDDYKLTHDIQYKQKENRLWKASKVDSFSANIVFILYKCKDNDLKVQLLHQERTVRFPGCTEDDLCPLKKLENILTYSVKNCDFSNICSLKKS